MRKKYKRILRCIGLLLMLTILLFISYVKFQKDRESSSPIVLVENGLSINYLNGNNLIVKDNDKFYSFSVTNNSDVTLKYHIELINVHMKNTLFYDLKETNDKLNLSYNELTKDNLTLANMISIAPGETHFYSLNLYKNDTNFSAKLSIGIEDHNEEYFSETILKNNTIKKSSATKIGTEVAQEDEGLIEAKNEEGLIYYYRGDVKNNYVSFANFTWRIVKINNDGSVELILNDYAETTANFYDSNSDISLEDKLNLTNNQMNKFLNEWYQENLKEYEKNIISNKFCVDDSIYETTNNINYYLGNNRLLKDYEINYNCLGTSYTMKIGLLSADEVVLAGANAISNNTNLYLYVPNKVISWWTLTPSISSNENITFFEVDPNGKLVSSSNGNYYKAIRPVIYLNPKTSVSGTGVNTDPYIVKD